MKKNIILALVAAMLMVQCNKDDDNNNQQQATLDPQVKQHNTDANNIKAELDQADSDIYNQLKDIPAFGKTELADGLLSSPLCGATIDSSQVAQKILFFNFDGVTPCFSPSRTRAGQIKVELISGNRWSDAGAVIEQTFLNYKVIRLSDNKSITINGVRTITNLNGNDWLKFILSLTTVKYRERAFNVDVIFDDNQHGTWNNARVTEWSYVQASTNPDIPYAHIIFNADGDTSLNGHVKTDMWGINRFNQNFITHFNAPVVSNSYCGLWRFNAGELVYHVDNNDFTLTLGTDQNGNATPYTCAYGYKVTWSSGGNSNSVILSY